MLQIDNLSFTYDKDLVLDAISFVVYSGEHIAVMGESGCGKSTLLKLIYGLLDSNEGTVYWNEKKIKGPAFNLVPGEASIKYLSQDFDLMPFTSAEENISEFLSVFYPDKRKDRINELLTMIEMEDFAKTKVKNLSGGQQQRVALARVLAQEPAMLLLDEPFSHIDNFRKNSLRRNLFGYLKEKKITCITATHDYHDVLPFADRAIVLRDQQILADEIILELYKNPKSIYTASLFGEANLIPINILKSYADTKRRIIVYSHEFGVSQSSGLPALVKKAYPMGSHYLIEAVLNDGNKVLFNFNRAFKKNKEVYLNVSLDTINQRLTPL